jgi:hypothetical protein
MIIGSSMANSSSVVCLVMSLAPLGMSTQRHFSLFSFTKTGRLVSHINITPLMSETNNGYEYVSQDTKRNEM